MCKIIIYCREEIKKKGKGEKCKRNAQVENDALKEKEDKSGEQNRPLQDQEGSGCEVGDCCPLCLL